MTQIEQTLKETVLLALNQLILGAQINYACDQKNTAVREQRYEDASRFRAEELELKAKLPSFEQIVELKEKIEKL